MTEPTLLFSLQTKLGCFTVEIDRPALANVTYDPPGRVYVLLNDLFPGYAMPFADVYEAIKAVAGHRTGLPDWDNSPEKASDYAGDWTRHIDKRVQRRMVEAYLAARPGECMRSIVDYFERRHFYYLDRHGILKVFREMIKGGDLKRLPSMRLAPAEMSGLVRLAKQDGCDTGDA